MCITRKGLSMVDIILSRYKKGVCVICNKKLAKETTVVNYKEVKVTVCSKHNGV